MDFDNPPPPPRQKVGRWFAPLAGVLALLAVVGALFAIPTVGHLPAVAPPTAVYAQGVAPNQQARNNGAEPGQVWVSWNAVPGATGYRVGWLNNREYEANPDLYLQRFAYSDVPASVTRFLVTNTVPGDEYWFIVGTANSRGGHAWGSWIQKFAVTDRPACAGGGGPSQPGQPGAGSPTATPRPAAATATPRPTPTLAPTRTCPAGGSALSPGTKRSLGSAVNWSGLEFGASSVTAPAQVSFGTIGDRSAPAGRKWLMINVALDNGSDTDVHLDKDDFVLETDAGIGYGWNAEATLRSGYRYRNGRNMLWDIPATARVAVVHIRPWIPRGSDYTPGVMWQMNVPQ